MGIAATFAEVDQKYRSADKCLEASRKFVEIVGIELGESLVVVSQAGRDQKFVVDSWPFHATIIGHRDGSWFGGTPGSSEMFCASNLDDLMIELVNKFGGIWPSAEEIRNAIKDGKRELELYAEDWVC